ncbi:MAG: PKD domain-containing protein [Sphingobacteriales bacterium]
MNNKRYHSFSIYHAVFVIVGILFYTLLGCKKETAANNNKPAVVNYNKPLVKFTYSIKAPNTGDLYLLPARVAFLDSNIYFKNKSDSIGAITYKWDFGDGSLSTGRNPVHIYSRRGKYKVVLQVDSANKVSDTTSMVISVILGQKIISQGSSKSLEPVDALGTADNGFLILGFSHDAKSYSNTQYFLMKTDSLLNQQSIYYYPSNYSFFSVRTTSDGNYLLTGNSLSDPSHKNQLFKVSEKGNIIWQQTYSNATYLLSAQETTNGNLLLTAENLILDQNGNTVAKTNIIETDGLGNQIWSKLLNSDLVVQYAMSLVLQNDGFVVAGSRPTGCYLCYADSIIMAKIDYNGKLIWQKTQPWSVPNYAPSDVYGAQILGGGYSVIGGGVNYGLYILSPQGALLKNVPFSRITPNYLMSDSDGDIVLFATDDTNQRKGVTYRFSPQGDQLWSRGFDTYVNQSWPITIHEFAKHRLLMLGRETEYLSGINYHFNILLLQLDDNNGNEL